jgi:hypothetical protein
VDTPATSEGIDIGIYTSASVLAAKLEDRRVGHKAEATWNMKRLPARLGKTKNPDRLFFASQGHWLGYFLLVPEILFNPADEEKPYSLIFNLNSWTKIQPLPVKPFRGFRYLQNMPR